MIKNSNKFRQAAIYFQDHGYYTPAPKGTTAWKDYWVKEMNRCLYGYTADDGSHITGYNYFYLNYSRILVNIERTYYTKRGKARKKLDRVKDFPEFWDYDKEYYDTIQLAEDAGKHLAVIKSRAKGYSFKGASMLCRNFYLIPDSISYAVAAEMEFLTKNGLLSKAWEMMDFVDEHTAWGKKRQKIDTKTHKKASFIVDKDGIKVEMGYKSEIIGISLKNDPQKHRGKRGKLMLWEEGGKHPNLKEAWVVARPSFESDAITFGQMIVFGTGGIEGANFEGLKDIFYEPDAYNCYGVPNKWDEGAQDTKCGFFVPQYTNMSGIDSEGNPFMDAGGNSLIQLAVKYELKQREIISSSASDRTTIDRYIAEKPFTPMEACLEVSGNIFPRKDLIRHLAELRNNKYLTNFKQVGELYFDNKGNLRWEQSTSPQDLIKYRLHRDDNKAGSIVIWEHPVEDPPYGLYIAGTDPYDHDQAGTGSLGSTFVYKRFQNFESYYDIPVAEYTGRPDTAEEYYENVRKLLLYYKAKCLYENEKKGLFSYFSHKHCEYLLADQPDIIRDIIQDSRVRRGKGIHMTQSFRDWFEGLIKEWLNEEYAPGKKNLTKIFSIPLLEELISYNEKGNFDRVDAFGLVMIYREELHHVNVKKKERQSRMSLFEKPLFIDEDTRWII